MRARGHGNLREQKVDHRGESGYREDRPRRHGVTERTMDSVTAKQFLVSKVIDEAEELQDLR